MTGSPPKSLPPDPPGRRRREERDPLPPGLISRTFSLPFRAPVIWALCAWPTVAAIVVLDLLEPGRTWRLFGAGPTVYRLHDALFLIGFCPLVGAWTLAAPRLFDGGRPKATILAALAPLRNIRFLALYGSLAGLYLAGTILVMAGAPDLIETIRVRFALTPPIGTSAWAIDLMRLLLLAAILFGAARFQGLLTGSPRPARAPIGPGRAILLAVALGFLHAVLVDTIIPLIAEGAVSVDVGLAQGLYRVLGAATDLYLVSVAAGFLAVMGSVASRGAASD